MTASQDAILTANKLMSQFSWTSFVDAETATKTRDAIAAALDEAAQERDAEVLKWKQRYFEERDVAIIRADKISHLVDEAERWVGKCQSLRARLARMEAVVVKAKVMRFYCLGSDASTMNMLEEFDAAIAALDEKES